MCDEGFGLTLIEEKQKCVDIDECLQSTSLCQGMKCRNAIGSFQCYCEVGFYANGSNTCTDINECLSNPCEDVCVNKEGSYECACKDGYGLTATNGGTSCVDIDECQQNASLCQGMKCRNAMGSYQCYCEVGFYANGNACTDINECLSNPCEDVCVNKEGSYECACKDGYGLTASNGGTSCVRRVSC